jgi:starch-binding outer membrane protein, SusD/RagB family
MPASACRLLTFDSMTDMISFRRFSQRLSVVALAAASALAGCKTSDYLEVESPSRIPAGNLESSANAQLLLNGAIADFECALGSYIVAGGLIGEELEDATQTSDRYPYDQRILTPGAIRYQTSTCQGIGTYSPLQSARVSSDNIRRLLEGWTDQEVPDRQRLLAVAAAYEGYSMLLMGEGFCATAFSHFNPDGTITYGAEITSAQALDSAINRFTQSITVAQAVGATADSIRYMALVGRARAKLDRGDLTGARADAVLVPASYEHVASASLTSGRRQNRIWSDNGVAGGGSFNTSSSVAAPYRNLGDTRVPVQNTGQLAGGTRIPIWVQTKYPTGSSPTPIATGDEAQLIVAEADIATNPANALAIINAFRAKGNETPLLPTATAAELKAALINERRRELFLEGQHLGDLIRYSLPLVPAAGTAYHGGGTYGSQRCMPLPDVEKLNNPALGGT